MKTKILILVSSSIKILLFSFAIILIIACNGKNKKDANDEINKNTGFDSVGFVTRK